MKTIQELAPAIAVAIAFAGATTGIASAQDIVKADLFVSHVSTLPANAGEVVPLHLLHKFSAAPVTGGVNEANRVVLFVHGATVPSPPDFDLQFEDYSWMDYLAQAGFDVWAMSHTGYGLSARPMMADPCNVNPEQQSLLIGRPLAKPCAAHHPRQVNTSLAEWGEIDSVVDYIRAQTGAERISLVGWSAGGPRIGGYAALYPDKVNRLFFFAPSAQNAELMLPEEPVEGFPTNLQTYDRLLARWESGVRCTNQVDPDVREPLWRAIMEQDPIGEGWGPEEGVMRIPARSRSGWTPEIVAELKSPMMVIIGEFDTPSRPRRQVYDHAASSEKVLLNVDCASHFMNWERQRHVMHEASLEWLKSGTFQNARNGEFHADAEGHITPIR